MVRRGSYGGVYDKYDDTRFDWLCAVYANLCTDSVEDLQMMSKTELNLEAVKAAGGHDKWLKTLDSNLRQMRKASVLYQDKMAVEKYADSIEGARPDPLEIGSYVLKVARPPQQESKKISYI